MITDGSEAPEEEIAGVVRERLRDHLTHIHLHDNKGVKDIHLGPGEGEINFIPIVEAIEAVGYRGQVIVEAWAPERSEEAGARALAAARRLFQTD